MKHPRKWKRIPLSDRASLPTQSGVYAVMDWRGQIKYIGRAEDLRDRWRSTGHHRYHQAKRLLWPRLAFMPCDNYKQVELELIRYYRPPWNGTPKKQHRTVDPMLLLYALALAMIAVNMPQLKHDLQIIWGERSRLLNYKTHSPN
jgi:hypothetical protein